PLTRLLDEPPPPQPRVDPYLAHLVVPNPGYRRGEILAPARAHALQRGVEDLCGLVELSGGGREEPGLLERADRLRQDFMDDAAAKHRVELDDRGGFLPRLEPVDRSEQELVGARRAAPAAAASRSNCAGSGRSPVTARTRSSP